MYCCNHILGKKGLVCSVGRNMIEIEQTFSTLVKQLEKWVDVNGLALNLKKTNYMIFSSNKRVIDLTFVRKIYKYEISTK